MKTTHYQACPLCGSPAKYHFVNANMRKHFYCAKCTDFQISKRAETRLNEAPQEWRDDYAAEAKRAPDNYTLVIRVPVPAQQEGINAPALSAEFAPDSELPD